MAPVVLEVVLELVVAGVGGCLLARGSGSCGASCLLNSSVSGVIE